MMFRVTRLSQQVIYARVRSNSDSLVAQSSQFTDITHQTLFPCLTMVIIRTTRKDNY
jgi:hypothetical protein